MPEDTTQAPPQDTAQRAPTHAQNTYLYLSSYTFPFAQSIFLVYLCPILCVCETREKHIAKTRAIRSKRRVRTARKTYANRCKNARIRQNKRTGDHARAKTKQKNKQNYVCRN